jgi:hypothetical protein
MAKPKEVYVLMGPNVVSAYDAGGGYFVVGGTLIDIVGDAVYTDKMDAMYHKLIYDLQKGKPLENYKSSKYFKQYIERLKKEHPEYIL